MRRSKSAVGSKASPAKRSGAEGPDSLVLGQRLRALRKRGGLSVRQLAERAGLSASMLSYVERGETSMSLVTLEKILSALGVSVAAFFSEQEKPPSGNVFPRETMQTVGDLERTYTILFGGAPHVEIEVVDEYIRPAGRTPPFTELGENIAGYVLSGELVLEVQKTGRRVLRAGDAFHVAAGYSHRGYVKSGEARLLTILYSKASKTRDASK